MRNAMPKDVRYRRENSNALDSTITWVCGECGKEALRWKYNARCHMNECQTQHIGKCDVCKKKKAVTHVRDYGYPIFRFRVR